MFDPDWSAILMPSGSLLEIAIRGTLVYLVLFLVMRFLPRRTLAEAGTSDILIIVLIADALQNAMAGQYRSVPEGLLLAGVIIGWALVIDWLDHRFPGWHLAGGKELALIDDGRWVRRNMAKQLITEDEVLTQLRKYGVESPERVRKCYIEADGEFTVILRRGAPVALPPERRKA